MISKYASIKEKSGCRRSPPLNYYVETLKIFKRQPKVQTRDVHVQYCFVWSEFALYPLIVWTQKKYGLKLFIKFSRLGN
jgi:hypothetical protein